MKLFKRFVLIVLTSSLFLVGCGEESGFSIAKNNENTEQQTTIGEDLKGDVNDNNSSSGATGAGNDKDQDDVDIKEEETGTTGQSTGLEETPVIDLGNQVMTFKFTFVKSDQDNYVNVSFDDDPFDNKYDFAYYTVNDQKLEKPEYRYKEIVDDVETYKIYLGSSESGTYVLKFFNSKDKQYGRVNVAVKFKAKYSNTPYISVAFNLVQVRAISLVFSVQNVFKKIGNFFSNLFNGDRISL